MSTNIKKWYDFVLQQMAAESYLDQSKDFGGAKDISVMLMLGTNNPMYLQKDQRGQHRIKSEPPHPYAGLKLTRS